jgi:tetratricopeptide (TPR) repeat protein
MSYSERDMQLNELFEQLSTAERASVTQEIETKIWALWLESGDEIINQMMEEATTLMLDSQYTKAIEIFSRVIEQMPDFVEAWNKRATAYFLRGDYKKSMDDAKLTLTLESRHFGALSGLASIYLTVGDNHAALRAFERILDIKPKQSTIQAQVKRLKTKVNTH